MIGLTFKLLGAASIIAVLLAASFYLGLLNFIFAPTDLNEAFCILVGTLAFGIDTADSAQQATRVFMAGFQEGMIDALPEQYRGSALVLVDAVEALAEWPGVSLALVTLDFLISAVVDAIRQMDGLCRV